MIINPASLLYENLKEINISRPDYETISRMSDFKKQFYIKSNSKDLFSTTFDTYDFTVSKEDAFKNLAISIKTFSQIIKFNLMVLPPKTVLSASLNIIENIIIRIIEYYDIQCDEILTRYDVLIEKVNSNA